jgi:mitochondrial fission protein ELM1
MTGGPDATVWVLDDPRAGTSAQAIGIAERLGVPFRRIALSWNWMAHVAGLARHGSLLGVAQPMRGEEQVQTLTRGTGPAAWLRGTPMLGEGPKLIISSGARSAAVALWLKQRFACHVVHSMRPGLAGLLRADSYELLVLPEHDRPARQPNIFPVLGAPHRVSPLALRHAAAAWHERLAHLPRPHVALLVGGPVRGMDMQPALAHLLGRKVARMTAARGGSVLATTSRRTGREASDALAAGLSASMHLLYRWGEPGDNPYLGFLASADAVVVTADSVSMLSEACATSAPVFSAVPELAGTRHRRLLGALHEAALVRPLGNDLNAWPRGRLDEAGRVAEEILRRFPID